MDKEEIKDIVHQALVWHEKYVAIKASNDELLKLLNQLEYYDDDDSDEWIRLPIRKAQALKEKEHQKK